jgi:arylsulfatase A-like enzyme
MPRLAPTLAAVAALVPAVSAGPAAAQPNVVVLMTDDQTQASMRYMTRTNQLLGDEGTTFHQSIATFPLCCPSRVTQLTGQYAHNHGVLHNSGPFGGYASFEHTNVLPAWLQAAGYRTMHVGRYLNGYQEDSGVPSGWTDWHGAVGRHAFDYASWQMNENGELRNYPGERRPREYQTDFLARRAVDLIERAAPAKRPFFLSLWLVAPHRGEPLDPDDLPGVRSPSPAPRHQDAFAAATLPRPPSFDEASVYDKPQVVADRPRLTPEVMASIEESWRQELESLLAVDEAVASVVGALERAGELDETLVLFTSDNGYMHGEHRRATGKVLPYEESVRVPLLMRGPGVPRGRHDRRLVANIDLAPTILDAAEVPPRRPQDGRSLLELLADPGLEWGRDILIENGKGANTVPMYRGIRTPGYLYVEHRTTGEYELYDLRNDPYQLTSLDGRERVELVQRDLADRLRRLANCVGPGCSRRPRLRALVRPATPPRGRCPREVRVRLSGPERAGVVRADLLLGRRRVASVRNPPFLRSLRLRRPQRRGQLVRARVTMRDGRRVTLDRRLRPCR